MKKSVICFILIIFLVYALPLSIHALPDNDYNSTYQFRYLEIVTQDYVNDPYIEPDIDFSFGEIYDLSFYNYSLDFSGSLKAHLTFTLDLESPADFFYLKSWDSPLNSYSFEITGFHGLNGSLSLSEFLVVDPITFNGMISLYEFTRQDTTFKIEGPYKRTNTGQLTFAGYAAIPADTYNITLRVTVDRADFTLPMGFFLDYHPTGDPVTDFERGELDFTEAASTIYDDLQEYLNIYNVPDATKQFQIALADFKLDRLREASDAKFSTVVDNFESTSDSIVDSYILSGSTDVLPAVSELNLLYTDALTQAVTPEQGTLINTRYSVKLQQLKTVFDVNYKKELDGALSDQDFVDKEAAMDRTDELLQIESDALQIFEDSEYQSYLTFVDWIHSTTDDPTVYRSIFEFLFEDPRSSSVHPFLIIPFSLVLVGVILATTTVVFRRRS